MAISKITLNGVTQMDVTGKTVTSGTMLNGITALKNDGTDITGNVQSKTSSDLTAVGATVTAPAGYYQNAASKTIPNADPYVSFDAGGFVTVDGIREYHINPMVSVDVGEGDTPGYLGEGTITGNTLAFRAIPANTTISPSTSSQTVGDANWIMEGPLTVEAMPSGSVTAPTSISGTSATVSTGTNTLTLSKTVSVTPRVTTAGYVSSGTAGNSSVSLTASVTTQAAQTIYPSTSDQTLTSGIYLTGAQTIKAVKITNLSAENIAAGVTVEIGDADDSDRIISVTGTMPNPLEITQYVTAANVFDSPHAQVTSYATVELTKNNRVCTLYLYMQPARWTAMGSGTVLGTLKSDFIPSGKSGTTAYVIFPLLSNTSPYAPCGSVWVYTQGTNRGKVISYFDSNATPGYLFLTYIAGPQN